MVVMLGFKDLEINKSDPVDWSTNKLGGLPDWLCNVGPEKNPRCVLCSNYLYHMVQVYCPLQNSSYHRTLNVFGCTKKNCWNKPESIVVIRTQKLEEKHFKEEKIVTDDDWGVNDWSNGNSDNWGVSNSEDDWGMSSSKEKFNALGDAISVSDEPSNVQSITSYMDNLTVNDSSGCSEEIPHFVGYHVYVETEDVVVPIDSNSYEIKLYQEYITHKGNVDSTPSSSNKSNGSNLKSEKYEKTQLKHGDEVFHQFKKRIGNYPGQVLRYEWDGKPLLLSGRSKVYPSNITIPSCPHCLSPRVFELQLMPNLVNCLHKNTVNSHENERDPIEVDCSMEHNILYFDGIENVRIEFGCIYIYSCSKSCWEQGEMRFEFALLQPDPDVDVLK